MMNIYKKIGTALFATMMLSSHSYATGEISIVGQNGGISSKNITTKKKVKRVNPLSILRVTNDSRVKRKIIKVQPQTIAKKATKSKSKKIKKAKIKKIIKKYPKQKIDRSRKKIAYLTFDDGPLRGTSNVLNILQSEGVDATMFFVGNHVKKNKKLFNRALSMSNILVSNHTYSHANGKYAKFYSNATKVINDIDKAQRLIGGAKYLRLAGRNVWRLPEVNRNDRSIKKKRRAIEISKYDALQSRGYFIYGWDTEWGFDHATGNPLYGAQDMVNKMELIHNKNRGEKSGKIIVLAHDYMFRTKSGASKLKELIRELKYNGWSFETLDEYSSSTPGVFASTKPIKNKKIKSTLDILRASSDTKIELETKLNEAIIKYATTDVAKLIDMGANPNTIDTKGRIALNTAVEANSLTIVRTLIQKGAKIINYDASGATPIATAVKHNHKRIKMYLEIELNRQGSKIALVK